MKTSELTFLIVFSVVATFIVTMLSRDWLRKRSISREFARRIQRDDEQFGEFFPDPKRAGIAIRTRRVLSNNLKMPFDGLAPSDRLNDDLNAELPGNLALFWDLEAEFGIKTGVEDLDTHEKTLERLVTFQDLVDFVERRIAESLPEPPATDEEKSSRIFSFAIRSIPILCIGGFMTAMGGIVVQKRTLINLGGFLFLSGAAVWGLANGGEMLRNMIRSARGSSWKETAARPWPVILTTCLALFFLWLGGTLVWGILKTVLLSK